MSRPRIADQREGVNLIQPERPIEERPPTGQSPLQTDDGPQRQQGGPVASSEGRRGEVADVQRNSTPSACGFIDLRFHRPVQ